MGKCTVESPHDAALHLVKKAREQRRVKFYEHC